MKTAEELYQDTDNWDELSNTYNFRQALPYIKDKQLVNSIFNYKDVIQILKILIKETNTFDDHILTITSLHLLEKDYAIREEILNKYGNIITECVILLYKENCESFANYANKIFTNTKYPYIRKILLADLLYFLRILPHTNYYVNKDSIINEIEKVILQYENRLPKILVKLIKDEITKLKTI